MSSFIGKIKSIEHRDGPNELHINSFWGGVDNGKCIQITIGSEFAMLNKKQVKKLRKLLKQDEQ